MYRYIFYTLLCLKGAPAPYAFQSMQSLNSIFNVSDKFSLSSRIIVLYEVSIRSNMGYHKRALWMGKESGASWNNSNIHIQYFHMVSGDLKHPIKSMR